jgi:hypothetical protein
MVRPGGPIMDGGTGPPHPPSGGGTKPPSGGGSGAPTGASDFSLITSTGGLTGLINLLVVPFFVKNLNNFIFASYDPTNFNCEENCIYNFKMEDVKPGRSIDVHKVYIQYRDIGKVTVSFTVTATLYDRVKDVSKIVVKTVPKTFGGKADNNIYSKFIDLKITGERPQLSILRKANAGPLAIITAMLVGNSSEEEQL